MPSTPSIVGMPSAKSMTCSAPCSACMGTDGFRVVTERAPKGQMAPMVPDGTKAQSAKGQAHSEERRTYETLPDHPADPSDRHAGPGWAARSRRHTARADPTFYSHDSPEPGCHLPRDRARQESSNRLPAGG